MFIPALNGGGAQRVVVTLANEFVNLINRPIHVVLCRKEGPFLTDLRPEVHVIDLKAGRTWRSIGRLALYLRRCRPVVIMSSLNYANIICTAAHGFAGRPCRLVLRETNVRVSAEISGTYALRQWGMGLLMRRLYPRADATIANSPDTLDSLLRAGIPIADKAVAIGNPVSIPSAVKRVNAASALSIPEGIRFLCAIGRLTRQKAFDKLIDAFAIIRTPEIHLIILGEGPERNALVHHARELGVGDRVHLPGFLCDAYQVVSSSQGVVLSSRWEGFGNVLVEALAMGVPVVATDCPGGPRMILEDGKYGTLVPVNDVTGLAKAMDDMLDRPTATPAMRHARAASFSPARIAGRYLDVLLPDWSRQSDVRADFHHDN
ncbi:MAG: glycosyltransferase [Aquisalimonadaceae bacterium]